jgi:hypothetical protein
MTWLTFTLLTEMPTYCKNILQFDITQVCWKDFSYFFFNKYHPVVSLIEQKLNWTDNGQKQDLETNSIFKIEISQDRAQMSTSVYIHDDDDGDDDDGGGGGDSLIFSFCSFSYSIRW